MDAKLEEVYGWDLSQITSLSNEIDEMVEYIEEVKSVNLQYDQDINKLTLLIEISGGKLINTYEIVMWIEKDYPLSLPYCFEKSNNFPRERSNCIERHITQEVDYIKESIKGSFCMVSPFRVSIVFKGKNRDAFNTTNLLLIDHLELQEYYTRHGNFLEGNKGVYSHGFFGLEQSLKEIYGGLDNNQLLRLLEFGVQGKLHPSNLCFCLSGKQIQNCHAGEMHTSFNIDFSSNHVIAMLEAVKKGEYQFY